LLFAPPGISAKDLLADRRSGWVPERPTGGRWQSFSLQWQLWVNMMALDQKQMPLLVDEITK
jgi:hypothetical protein